MELRANDTMNFHSLVHRRCFSCPSVITVRIIMSTEPLVENRKCTSPVMMNQFISLGPSSKSQSDSDVFPFQIHGKSLSETKLIDDRFSYHWIDTQMKTLLISDVFWAFTLVCSGSDTSHKVIMSESAVTWPSPAIIRSKSADYEEEEEEEISHPEIFAWCVEFAPGCDPLSSPRYGVCLIRKIRISHNSKINRSGVPRTGIIGIPAELCHCEVCEMS